jgi:hypothetical protein
VAVSAPVTHTQQQVQQQQGSGAHRRRPLHSY